MGNKRTQKINVFYTIIKITKQSVRVLVLKIYKTKNGISDDSICNSFAYCVISSIKTERWNKSILKGIERRRLKKYMAESSVVV